MADEEGGFDPALKKKKKKKPMKMDDDEEEPKPEPEAVEEVAEKVADLDIADQEKAADEDGADADFTAKKKKKKAKPAFVDEDEEGEKPAEDKPEEEEDAEAEVNFEKKKKKKKKKVVEEEEGAEEEKKEEEEEFAGKTAFDLAPGNSERDYKYEELLGRMFAFLSANNPDMSGDRKRLHMKPPQVVREGSKKVVLINFAEICKLLRRSEEHVFAFMLVELGTTGSIDGTHRMVIKGRFQPKAIEGIVRRYAAEYVSCGSCKSPDTDLVKENRLYFMTCNTCGARRSVAPIKSGFVAQVGRRKKTAA